MAYEKGNTVFGNTVVRSEDMSLSAAIKIELNTVDVIDIVECLICNGWSIRDAEGKISFLPVDDNEYYSWSAEFLTDVQLKLIIKSKLVKKEVIGLFFYKDNVCYTNILFLPSSEIIVNCDINRKIIQSKDGIMFTDVNWYINEVIVPLIINGYQVRRFEYIEIR